MIARLRRTWVVTRNRHRLVSGWRRRFFIDAIWLGGMKIETAWQFDGLAFRLHTTCRGRQMTDSIEPEEKLEILHRTLLLDLRMNELRIMVGCFKAVSYLMEIDDEPYLDADALELQKKLEQKYSRLLGQMEDRRAS
jgi:hypothetical protein